MIFVGDDWAEDHHDLEVVDESGRRLARRRVPEGVEGLGGLHVLVGDCLDRVTAVEPGEPGEPGEGGEGGRDPGQVIIGIEVDRGPWVQALLAAGYQVYAINPLSVARYRERHSTSGAKSDAGDAHVLAEIVRLDHAHHRPIAGDSPQVEAMKVVARAHQSLVWDRSRQVLRLRSALREFFPAALDAFDDLDAPDTLEILGRGPDPDRAARLSRAQLIGPLRRANRRDIQGRATRLQ